MQSSEIAHEQGNISSEPVEHMVDLRVACSLSGSEQAKREAELAEGLFSTYEPVEELADGYAFRYPGDMAWATRLLEFIGYERECCRFMTFELVFEPNGGPVWLRARGPDGTKEFVRGLMHR